MNVMLIGSNLYKNIFYSGGFTNSFSFVGYTIPPGVKVIHDNGNGSIFYYANPSSSNTIFVPVSSFTHVSGTSGFGEISSGAAGYTITTP